jgi:hypothetical protein
VELIFKRYLKTILKRSPRIGIGFVSPFIALKMPYDQSTETKTHMEAENKLSKLLIIRPSEMKVSVIPTLDGYEMMQMYFYLLNSWTWR